MTLHANVPVHQFKILLDDVKAKPHAIKIAGVRFLDLLKGAEDSIHILSFNADARIGDGKFNAARGRGGFSLAGSICPCGVNLKALPIRFCKISSSFVASVTIAGSSGSMSQQTCKRFCRFSCSTGFVHERRFRSISTVANSIDIFFASNRDKAKTSFTSSQEKLGMVANLRHGSFLFRINIAEKTFAGELRVAHDHVQRGSKLMGHG